MPNLARSPPLNKSASMSDSDINRMASSSSLEEFGVGQATQRDSKRRRISIERPETEGTDFRFIIREELRDMVSEIQLQQNSRLDKIEKYIAEIKTQNDTIHKKNLVIEKSIEFVTAMLDDLQSIIQRLEVERKHITEQITKISDKCDTLERLHVKPASRLEMCQNNRQLQNK
ncbi:hypothetical protein ACJJTC_012582 [Scirpophaga incertulas]